MNQLNEQTVAALLAAFNEGMGVNAAAEFAGVAKVTASKYLHRLDPIPLCKCGQSVSHKGFCHIRYAASPRRQQVIKRMHRNRKRNRWKRDITEYKYIGGGWWEFWLACGHGGKLLLGQASTYSPKTMTCYPCSQGGDGGRT